MSNSKLITLLQFFLLLDIVGIIGFVEPPSVVINEQGHEEKFVEFGITDGMLVF